jgi:hypothetical protein
MQLSKIIKNFRKQMYSRWRTWRYKVMAEHDIYQAELARNQIKAGEPPAPTIQDEEECLAKFQLDL